MKANQLKKIIKEAVREAVREELKEILTEAVTSASQPTRQPVAKPVQETTPTSGDPIMEMLNMTQQSMTRDDFKNVMGGQAHPGMNEMNFTTNSLTPSAPSGPVPGIDISKLDFVNKASAVFNKAIEKDKFRIGG